MELLTPSAIVTLALTKSLEKTAEKFTEAALTKIDMLRKNIVEKLKGYTGAETALLEAEKGSKTDLETVVAYLHILMHQQPKFAEEIQAIAKEIQAGQKQAGSKTQINRDNATGFLIEVNDQGTVFAGTNHIKR
jgi:hypothetical protein